MRLFTAAAAAVLAHTSCSAALLKDQSKLASLANRHAHEGQHGCECTGAGPVLHTAGRWGGDGCTAVSGCVWSEAPASAEGVRRWAVTASDVWAYPRQPLVEVSPGCECDHTGQKALADR